MKFLILGLCFAFFSHAQTAVVAQGEGIQYQRKATGIAKDVARENARHDAVRRCSGTSEHIQRVSAWTYKRKGSDTIVARATFVCGTVASGPPRHSCYTEGTHLDLRLCDKCCSKNCSYIAGSPIGMCN